MSGHCQPSTGPDSIVEGTCRVTASTLQDQIAVSGRSVPGHGPASAGPDSSAEGPCRVTVMPLQDQIAVRRVRAGSRPALCRTR